MKETIIKFRLTKFTKALAFEVYYIHKDLEMLKDLHISTTQDKKFTLFERCKYIPRKIDVERDPNLAKCTVVSSDKTEIIYSSTKRELELWFCLYKPIYIEYIDDNLRNDVYTMILDVLSNIKLHNSKDLKLEKVKTEMHNFLFNQSNKIEDLPLFIERINNITNVESKNKMIRINRDVFEVYAE